VGGGGGGGHLRLLLLGLVLAAAEAVGGGGALLGELRVGRVPGQARVAQLGGARVLVQAVARPGGAEVGLDVGGVQPDGLLAVLDHLAVVLLQQLDGRPAPRRGGAARHIFPVGPLPIFPPLGARTCGRRARRAARAGSGARLLE
jgi:hypothetical protein